MGKIGWSDDSVKVMGKDTKFKLEAGRVDIVRIIDKCRTTTSHYLEEKQKTMSCSKAEFGKCPLCKAGYKPNTRFACTIMHVAIQKGRSKKTGNMKYERVGTLKVWIFSPSVYTQIREINAEYGDVRKYDLKITCSDSKFQRIGSILPCKKSLIDDDMKTDITDNKDLIDNYLKTKSPKELRKMLESAGGGEAVELSLDEDDKPRKHKSDDDDEDDDSSKKKKKKHKSEDEDDDEFDDLMEE